VGQVGLSPWRTRVAGIGFGAFLAAPAIAQGQLVFPLQLTDLAKTHNCRPVSGFVTDEQSNQAAPFSLSYEFHYEPAKVLLTAWCFKNAPNTGQTYTLLILAERQDHPLRTCPDEIPNIKRIGRPSIEAEPMIPHDFVMLNTGERLTVREPRVMFGVRNHVSWGQDFYACVAGRWAHYEPEKK
jgi:hypothetical protein